MVSTAFALRCDMVNSEVTEPEKILTSITFTSLPTKISLKHPHTPECHSVESGIIFFGYLRTASFAGCSRPCG